MFLSVITAALPSPQVISSSQPIPVIMILSLPFTSNGNILRVFFNSTMHSDAARYAALSVSSLSSEAFLYSGLCVFHRGSQFYTKICMIFIL